LFFFAQVANAQVQELANLELSHKLPGTKVTVFGLLTKPDLNGETGEVLSWDAEVGRYAVQFAKKAFKLKPANIRCSDS
jgi:hypothetical protein